MRGQQLLVVDMELAVSPSTCDQIEYATKEVVEHVSFPALL